jgi:hypothetical protein
VSRRLLLIKRKVEFGDVDDGLAQETERAAGGVFAHQIASEGKSDDKRSQADQQRNESYVQHADLRQF